MNMPTTDEPQNTVRQIVAYHAESRKNLALLMLGVLVLIALIGALIFLQIISRPAPMNFALNEQLQIIDPVPLDQPGIQTAALLNWINDVLIKAFSYNYSNEDKQLAKLEDSMSEAALDAYQRLLDTDENLAAVRDLAYVVSVKPKAAPEILVARSFKGRYAWQIRVPVIIKFSNALMHQDQDVQVEFLVLRVPETESALGVKVAGFNYRVLNKSARQNVVR